MDWRFILAAVIALAFVLIIGGYYWKLKKEITEAVEALIAISQAIKDPSVNDVEIARLIDRALVEIKDVEKVIKIIALSVAQLISKR